MCLDIVNWLGLRKRPKIAKAPITVYKILIYCPPLAGNIFIGCSDKERHLSPYKLHPYTLGVEERSQLLEDTFNSTVEEGLHSFAKLSDAKTELKKWGKRIGDGTHAVIYEATIPAGAKYYKGRFGPYKSYASDRLLVKRMWSVTVSKS